MDGENTASTEPVDIASAFQMVREMDQASSEPDVQDGGAGDQGAVQPEPAQPEPAASEPAPAAEPQVDENAGGSATEPQVYDYSPARQELINSIQRQAASNVSKMFADNDVKIVSIQELYSRGEDGTVTFHNPDNPEKPFESRAEAQAWVDAMNTEIQRAYNDNVMQETQKLYNQAAPAMQLLYFAPTYDAMDRQTKETFDMLIEPYAIRGANGQIFGFNCNLNAMAQQAIRLVGKFSQPAKQPQPAAQKTPSEPVMDIKTGSGTAPKEEEEPKTLEEAMAMLNKRRKNNG